MDQSVEQQIAHRLKEIHPFLQLEAADIWDVVAAARGVTVFSKDGRFFGLTLSRSAARQLLHAWHVEVELVHLHRG